MKLPSLQYLFQTAKTSLFRFPLTLLSAFVSVCISVYLVEYGKDIRNFFPYVNTLLVCALGIPLYFCVSVITVKFRFNRTQQIGSIVGATILLVLIYLSLPTIEITHNRTLPYIRYGIFNAIIHLLVSFIPYVTTNKLNGFWNYNKTLFIRFLVSLLYSGFLYVGLILALTALNLLFNIDIHEELYAEFYIVIIGLFNTWFFVSGIPTDLDALEEEYKYPRGLKIFTQYILLPLLTLYMVILYVYGGKILMWWEWPKGIVSYLISCVATLGILTLLLIHPYGNTSENAWIKRFTKIYYYSLFPLIGILFIAISFRINDYGITINRYVIILLGIWLFIVATYFSLRKTNIKFIPISLALIMGLMSFGPWGMFSVGERSQSNRLRAILEKYNLLENGNIKNEPVWKEGTMLDLYPTIEAANDNILPDSVHNEVYSILEYLDTHHGFSSIHSLYKTNIDSLLSLSLDSNQRLNEASIYMRALGLPYEYKYTDGNTNYVTYTSETKKLLPITGYDYLIELDNYYYNRENQIDTFLIDGITYTLMVYSEKNTKLTFTSKDDSLSLMLTNMLEALKKEYGNSNNVEMQPIPSVKMKLTGSSKRFEVAVQFKSLQCKEEKDSTTIENIHGYVLLKRRN